MYGCILYYATSMFDHYYKGVVYSRPEFLYFWCYYFLMNFFWIMIPGGMYIPSMVWRMMLILYLALLTSSVKQIAKAFKALDSISAKTTKGKKGQ
jgi:cholestenol delta-isomerase